MAKYTKIPTSTFETIQINAGVLLTSFDPSSASVTDANILGATTGGINFTATPSYSDYGEDIDNCPKNTLELKKLDDWEIKCSGTFVTVSAALAARLAAAADVASNKVTPRRDLAAADFKDLWLVGDYSNINTDGGTGSAQKAGFVAIEMMFYLLGLKIIFFAILSVLALVGLIFLVAQGIKWFSGDEEQRLDPAEIAQEDAEEEVVDTYTYDQIRAEVGGDEA